MHECIPYENVVPFSIQRAVFVTEGCGTHKCVPYEDVDPFPIQSAAAKVVTFSYEVVFQSMGTG